MSIPVSAQFLALVVTVLGVTQAIKRVLEKVPFIVALIAKLTGHPEVPAILSILLSGAVGILAGLKLYGADGSLTWDEVQAIIASLVAANGLFNLSRPKETVTKVGGTD